MSRRPATIGCSTLLGVDALPTLLEATLHGDGHGAPRLLGRAGPTIREAYFRILAAYRAVGLPPVQGIATVNLLPAGIPKRGTGYDLPFALALLAAAGQVPREALAGLCAHGEIALGGAVLSARGVVSAALAARRRGWPRLLCSHQDASLAARVPGLEVYGVDDLGRAVAWLTGHERLDPARPATLPAPHAPLDLADLRGHDTPKRALAVAAAGRHHMLMVGPPGSGKTALARRLPGLLPPPGEDETLDILKIATLAPGRKRWSAARPFRAPHHTSSGASLLGGGTEPRPGECTLAHHGVLFLDELPEFRRDVLEGLREPLEEGAVTLGRAARTVTLPARFQLVAAMNPCPCGHLGHPQRPCRCTPARIQRYRHRLSGPLLDRFDLLVDVPALDPAVFRGAPDTDGSTAVWAGRIGTACDRQRHRGTANATLEGRHLERAVRPTGEVEQTLEEVLRRSALSARSRVRLLRVARTLADLDGRDRVGRGDVLEAAGLRRALPGGGEVPAAGAPPSGPGSG